MTKNQEEKLKNLIAYLRAQSQKGKKITNGTEYVIGTEQGIALAYEMCADWIEEILEEKE